jgi:single-strand DNA-binding protein
MSSVNQVNLLGRVGKDPESRSTRNANAVVNLSLATSENWTDKQTGEKQERTEWHNLVAFGRSAEVIAEYVGKGDLLFVTGNLRTEKWQDKEGNDRYTTKVYVDRVVLMPKSTKGNGEARDEAQAPARARTQTTAGPNEESFDDEITF